MLEQEDLLLDLLWHLIFRIAVNLLLPTRRVALCVGDSFGTRVSKHLRVVIEVDSDRPVRQRVPQPVLGAVVHPLLDPDCRPTLVQLRV